MQNGLWASGSWLGGNWNSGGNLWLASRDPSHQTVLGLCQNPEKRWNKCNLNADYLFLVIAIQSKST